MHTKNLGQPIEERCKITFRYEQRRAVASGVLEASGQTFLLLIAVAVFTAGATAKAFVVLSVPLGMLLSPLVLSFARKLGWPVSKVAAALMLLSGAAMLMAVLIPTLPVYVPMCVLAFFGIGAIVPLGTKIYQDNYPEANRGALFSRSAVIRIFFAAGFAWVGGKLMGWNLDWFRWILFSISVAFFYSAYCFSKCPSHPLQQQEEAHPFHALGLVKTDRILRWTTVSWMLMGFSNLVMAPLRVEYLANPVYAINLSPEMVALLTAVLPNTTRLVMSRVWGTLFDKMNFFLLRIILNMGFVLGILSFFVGQSMTAFVIGALIFGVSIAGGDIAWSLWVTKIAPEGKVAEYMSVHTFFTGIRGLIAPFAAFYLVQIISLPWLATACASMIVIASLLLVPEAKTWYRRRAAQPIFPKGEE